MAEAGSGHSEHDPFAIAALLDPGLANEDRQDAEALVAMCPECAALHADLLAVASATADLPTPTRPRDFRLTADDAARLAAASIGEPVAPPARLAGVMNDRPTSADHAGHDPLLVAALVDHSLTSTERAAAESLVAACGACAGLHADLLVLRDATRAMPTPPRPRDYTLTPGDAARLRRGGWRRLVAAFGSSRDAFSRPLAMGLTTLGLAGLLLASVPSLLPMSGSTAAPTTVGDRGGLPQPEMGTDSNRAPVAVASPPATGGGAEAPVAAAPSAAAAPAATAAPAAAASAPAASAPPKQAFGPVQSAAGDAPPSAADFGFNGGQPGAPGGGQGAGSDGVTSASGFPLLLLVSGLFLVTGLALFAIRRSARRLGDG